MTTQMTTLTNKHDFVTLIDSQSKRQTVEETWKIGTEEPRIPRYDSSTCYQKLEDIIIR